MSVGADELLLSLQSANAEILAQNPDANILALMEKAAIEGFRRGSAFACSAVQSKMLVMQAQSQANAEKRQA